MAASKKTFHKKHLHPELLALNAEIPMPSLPTETEIPVPSLPTEIPIPKRDYEKKLANIKKWIIMSTRSNETMRRN